MNTDAIMVSLKNIPVGDCDNVLHFVSAKQNNRQPNDDLAESLFSSPPASPQKKCIQPNIKGHSVLECKKMLALQQDIEELEFYPKLRVFWGHETHQKLQKDSQNSHAKRGKRLKCGKNKAKILVDISELPSLITLACVQSDECFIQEVNEYTAIYIHNKSPTSTLPPDEHIHVLIIT